MSLKKTMSVSTDLNHVGKEENAAPQKSLSVENVAEPRPETPDEMWKTKQFKSLEEEKRYRELVMRTFLNQEEGRTTDDYKNMYLSLNTIQANAMLDSSLAITVGRKEDNKFRNRYRDIAPYDFNRVVLKKTQENWDGYINASFIYTPYDTRKKYIAAQGPLPATLSDWWRMIEEQNVKLIVNLCQLVEQGAKKCERYWPEFIGTTMTFGLYEVTMTEELFLKDEAYTRRTLEVKNQETMETRTIRQLHYQGWPDHGCPDNELPVLKFIQTMEMYNRAHSKGAPMLLHCSAGVGRTGSIIAISYLREQIRSSQVEYIDIMDLVIKLRRQRMYMVQSVSQLAFVCKCIHTICARRLEPPKIQTSDHEHEPVRAPPTRPRIIVATGVVFHRIANVVGSQTLRARRALGNWVLPDPQ